MAGRIRQQDIEAVRQAARIEVVVGERVALKPAGVGSLKGLCPFHDERTPSFHVRPALGLWHCFGCSEGGDTIKFVMQADALGFLEAVEYLAGRFNITLQYEAVKSGAGGFEPGGEAAAPTRARLLEANRLAAEFYTAQLALPEAITGRDFLRERTLDRLAADRFGLGYSPNDWDGLLRFLAGKGFTQAEMLAAGLVSQGQRGLYDRFRGRLMWPIRDLTGAVVGFGARRLGEEDQGPKYLNTPETALYKKSQVLYGVDLAKTEIAKRRRVVVVEGYTDVMACHEAGVKEAIATCGTAFGADHIRVVRRLLGDVGDIATGVLTADGAARGGKVVFTFDGDAAGQKAALRAFQGDQSFYAQTFVVVLPGGLDPCELRHVQGNTALSNLIDRAQPMFKFAIRTALDSLDLETAEGRAGGLRASAPIVAGIRDDVIRRDYARQLAGWVRADEDLVLRAVQSARGQARARPGEAGPDLVGSAKLPGAQIGDPIMRAEYLSIAAVLQHPELVPASFDQLTSSDLQTPALQAIHDAVVAAGGVEAGARDPSSWVPRVSHQATSLVRGAITQMAVEPLPTIEAGLPAYVRGLVDSLVEKVITHQIAQVEGQLRQIEATDRASEYDTLLARSTALRQQQDALRADQGEY